MRLLSILVTFVACTAVFLSVPHARAAERPNVVFILADDLGYGDIEAFGGDLCNVDTPHFDALCADGMKFSNAHVTDSHCVPSRTSIMTGRYAFRFAPPGPGGPWGFLSLQFPPAQFTLGRMLQQSGYTTGYVGKWHLGTRMATRNGGVQNATTTDFTQPLEVGPNDYGFDESFILAGSLDMFPYAFIHNHRWVGDVTAEKGWSAFNRRGPAAEDFEDVTVLDTFCGRAEDFIATQATSNTPFFLYVALTAPHTPTSPSKSFEGKSRIGLYGDFVMNTDACIGRVVAALEEHGLTDNTLVIASSDHGPGHYSGRLRQATANQMQEMEKDGHRPNGPWRGYKFSVFEGGTRVPFAAKWPGTIPASSESDALVGLQDLMATIGELAGVSFADDQAPDSISFLPLLRDPAARPPRTSMVIRGTRGSCVRDGDWKLLLCPGSGSAGRFFTEPEADTAWRAAIESFGRKPRSAEELEQPPFLQLFNLADDPGETTNLAAEHPERVREMITAYRKILDAGRSTPGPALPNGRELQVFQPVPGFVWKN
jgi:arylsulfatase A